MSAAPTVAVVLTGAAARGAFQAGALARLLPALHEQGLTPRIYLGTSAGAINATLYGSLAHLPLPQATDELLGIWGSMGAANVIRPPVASLLGDGVRFGAGALFGLGHGIVSVFDTAPLQRTAREVLDAPQLAANVASGVLDAVGVAATRVPPTDVVPAGPDDPAGHWHVANAHTVLFLDTTLDAAEVADPGRALRVAAGPVAADHVLASSAIPVAFPPIEVAGPQPFGGWYLDGGIRLNAPLRPAVALGADHVVVIAAHATAYPQSYPLETGEQPDVLDATALTLQSVLADRVIEDLAGIRTRNRWLAQGAQLCTATGRDLHRVSTLVVSPEPGVLAELATQALHDKRFDPQALAMQRVLRGLGDGPGAMELLSYAYFDREYFRRQIDLGRQAAEAALAAGWQL
jgi:NTE family protein